MASAAASAAARRSFATSNAASVASRAPRPRAPPRARPLGGGLGGPRLRLGLLRRLGRAPHGPDVGHPTDRFRRGGKSRPRARDGGVARVQPLPPARQHVQADGGRAGDAFCQFGIGAQRGAPPFLRLLGPRPRLDDIYHIQLRVPHMHALPQLSHTFDAPELHELPRLHVREVHRLHGTRLLYGFGLAFCFARGALRRQARNETKAAIVV